MQVSGSIYIALKALMPATISSFEHATKFLHSCMCYGFKKLQIAFFNLHFRLLLLDNFLTLSCTAHLSINCSILSRYVPISLLLQPKHKAAYNQM